MANGDRVLIKRENLSEPVMTETISSDGCSTTRVFESGETQWGERVFKNSDEHYTETWND